jgi:steroid 5-alpha reductase family enzyme
MDIKRIIIYTVLAAITVAIATIGFTKFGDEGLLYPMLITLGYFTVFFIVAQIIKDNSIVDMGWGLGFVFGAWATILFTENPTILSFVIAGFITLWGVRLSARLIRRNWGKPEDFRYANWRKEWGSKVVIIAFFRVFMIQGIINFIVGAASYYIIKFNTFAFEGISMIIVIIGLVIAATGLFFEVVGDEQLRKHIAMKTKKLMDKGLWSITRHPNYFGEIAIWTGLYIVGFSMLFTDANISIIYYLIMVISPLLMSTVLIKISTPMLEKHMSKYDGWEAYTKKVPMIFPWGKADQ